MTKKVNFTIRDFELTEENKEYILTKFNKINDLYSKPDNTTITIFSVSHSKSKLKNLVLEFLVKYPKVIIKVEVSGTNINTMTDEAIPILLKRLERYHNNAKWQKKLEWKTQSIEKGVEVDGDNFDHPDYKSYVPSIKRKVIDNLSPMHPAEAIESMELIGHNSYFFKNIETGKYAMIYRRQKGGYGLLEPKE